MQQPFIHPRDDRAAYEYSIQATEDRHEPRPGYDAVHVQAAAGWRPERRPNYKPSPLRWPFITSVIAFLLVAIALVVVAEKRMPDSDSDAIILGIHPNASQPVRVRVRFARAVILDTSVSTSDGPTTDGTTTIALALSTTSAAATTVPQITESALPSGGSMTTQVRGSVALTTSTVPASVSATSASPSLVSTSASSGVSGTATLSVPSSSASASTPSSSLVLTLASSSVSGTATLSVLSSPASTSTPSFSSALTSASSSVSRTATLSVPSSPASTSTSSFSLVLTSASSSVLGTTTLSVPSSPASISTLSFSSVLTSASSSVLGTTTLSVPSSPASTSTLSFSSVLTSASSSVSGTATLSVPSSASSSTPSAASTHVDIQGVATDSSGTAQVTSTSTVSLPSGASLIPTSVSISKYTTNVTVPVSTQTFTSVFTTVTTGLFTSVSTYTTTLVSNTTSVEQSTFNAPTVVNGTSTMVPVTTATHTVVIPTTAVSTVETTMEGTTTVTAVETVKGTSTLAGVVIPSVGEVTITYFRTVLPDSIQPVTQPPIPVAVPVTGVQVIDETTVQVVETLPPVILAVSSDDVRTEVINQVSTGVIQVGGSVVTSIVVFTPSPGVPVQVVTTVGGTPVTVVTTPSPVTAVTLVDGVKSTIVKTLPPQTVVTVEGGIATTINAFLAPSLAPPGQPVTYTVVGNVGGAPVTRVLVSPPTGAPLQRLTITTEIGGIPTVVAITPAPSTIVETVDGTPVTRVTTPPVTSFTTTVGGTLTTETLVIDPTGTQPLTLTFLSTIERTLSTFTTTLPPSTFLTTISATVMTITSTPSPRTSYSTRPRSTRTFTSTSTQTTSPTSSSSPVPPVLESTKVYRWTEADIFVGTFLPPLLGVGLVIPLRIIDLNAKLYQPFQTMARPMGGPGAETLLLQYTGLMAFLMPVVTLVQGHPVPFLTTLMVLIASFMVPLATEGIGLKLHGVCYLNTASPTCGPALGVTPAPANALVGLMAAVIVILLVVLFLTSRWVTGLKANPWSIAGIASLARNSQIRIHQSNEKAMRRAVADKQYGLGYFRNAAGREEYGIVLMDEAGRGLQDGVRGDNGESDGLGDAQAAMTKGSGLGRTALPFMPLRYPWRIAFLAFQLAVLIFIIYYHAYYRGGIRDGGRLWMFLNSNTFGVRFVSAVIGVIIAFGWQSFFLSVSIMIPYQLLAHRTQPPRTSILLTTPTNPFSGLYASLRHLPSLRLQGLFPLAVATAAVLSEFLPVLLSNVPFNLAQTVTAATACAVLSCVVLGLMLAVLTASFFVRYPPMPADPRCLAGALYYVSKSRMVVEEEDFEGVALLGREERARRVGELGRRYFYGVLLPSRGGGAEGGEDDAGRRLGVDCDVAGEGEDGMGYRGARA